MNSLCARFTPPWVDKSAWRMPLRRFGSLQLGRRLRVLLPQEEADSPDEDSVCRFCWQGSDDAEGGELLAPCRCSGSVVSVTFHVSLNCNFLCLFGQYSECSSAVTGQSEVVVLVVQSMERGTPPSAGSFIPRDNDLF